MSVNTTSLRLTPQPPSHTAASVSHHSLRLRRILYCSVMFDLVIIISRQHHQHILCIAVIATYHYDCCS